jgi:uncharacterized protein (DUF342 family)
MTQASLVCNKSNNLDLVLKPAKVEQPISESSIHSLIAASEYTELYVNKDAIKNAIAELNEVLKPLQQNQSGREINYQILERRDALVSTFKIDQDEMSVTAEITTAMGGKHLSAKALLNAAQTSGIKKGFIKEELIQLAQLAGTNPSGTLVSAKIAVGKPAIRGKDAKIKPLVQSAQDRILRPQLLEDGSVDMRDLGDIICVKSGDPLTQKIPLTLGSKGYTVTGKVLEPEPGDDIQIVSGKGTEVSARNPNILISLLDGLPKVIENGMEVDDVYKIKKVYVGSGNVDYDGSVIIKGDVSEGMKVIASGDITVGGCVESATLISGGDITISGGIIGRKHEVDASQDSTIKMSVNIQAKGRILSKYCQYADIQCDSDVYVEKQLMHSILDINGKLWVGTAKKANGKLIGGLIKVDTSVHAGIIGATAGSNTTIIFERRVDTFKLQIQEIDGRLKIESDQITELKQVVNKLKKLPKDKANPALLQKVISQYQLHARQMGAITLEKDLAENELQEYMCGVYIEATDKLHHGVVLQVGDFNDKTRREYGPSRMLYKERKIHIDPIINT